MHLYVTTINVPWQWHSKQAWLCSNRNTNIWTGNRPGNTSSYRYVRWATWQHFFVHVCEAGHMATLFRTCMWGGPHGNTSSYMYVRRTTWQHFFVHVCVAGHMATLFHTCMWDEPHGNTFSYMYMRRATWQILLPTSMWGRPHGNSSSHG